MKSEFSMVRARATTLRRSTGVLLALLFVWQVVPEGSSGRLALSALAAPAGEASESSLPALRVTLDAVRVDVVDNLSGLAYDPARDRLWSVVNNPPSLLALDRRGSVLGRHALVGFEDVEAVAYLGDDLLLLVEERRSALVLVPVPATGQTIERGLQESLTLPFDSDGNDGLEGAAYDVEGDRLYVVKEHSPRRLYEIRGLKGSRGGRLQVEIIDRSAWVRDGLRDGDLASVEYVPASGYLLLLDEESKRVVELDRSGNVVAERALERGEAALRDAIPQPEGLAVDGDGNVFIVSEPNLFYAFSPGQR